MLSSVDSDKYLSNSASALEVSPEADGLVYMVLYCCYIVILFTYGANYLLNTSSQQEEETKCSKMKLMLKANIISQCYYIFFRTQIIGYR